jgi:hypothetical protein
MIITLDCHPPKECSPNARVHWSARAKAAHSFRSLARLEAEIQTPNDWNAPDRAFVKLTIICAEDRIRDADNWLCRFKPGMDGLVDAGVLTADDVNHLTVTGVEFIVDAENAPKTIIDIEAAR